MQIEKSDLVSAATRVGISLHQAEELWSSLQNKGLKASSTNAFDLPHILYYLGAMIVIASFSWLLGLGWERFGGGGILLISLAYIALFVVIGNILWNKKQLTVPGGLFVTMAVCLVPLAIYGFQEYTGKWLTDEPGHYRDFFSWVQGRWFMMELGTIIAGCLALYFYPFPFLTAPVFFSLWFMSMDITPLLFNTKDDFWTEHVWVSGFFGLAILIVSYLIDRRTEKDFAFWGYLFGILSLGCSLSILLLDPDSGIKRFIYLLISLGFILISILLQRTIFLIFGAMGVFSYIAVLASQYFSDSILFPFILSLIGILIVFLGIVYHKNHLKIEEFFLKHLPENIKNWLPKSRN